MTPVLFIVAGPGVMSALENNNNMLHGNSESGSDSNSPVQYSISPTQPGVSPFYITLPHFYLFSFFSALDLIVRTYNLGLSMLNIMDIDSVVHIASVNNVNRCFLIPISLIPVTPCTKAALVSDNLSPKLPAHQVD